MRMSQRGLSLIESIFSMFLVAAVLLVVLNLLPSASLASRLAGQRSFAGNLARSEIEAQFARSFEDLVPGSYPLAPGVYDGVEYQPTLEIFAVPGNSIDRLLGLRVVVNWNFRGISRHLTHEVWRSRIRR